MFYLLNFDELEIVSKHETELDCNEAGRKSKFGYLVIADVDSLMQLKGPHLLALRPKVGLSEVKTIDSKINHCEKIWEAIQAMDFEVVKAAKPRKKAEHGPTMGSKIKELLFAGELEGLGRAEIVAKVQEFYADKTAKQIMSNYAWYKNAVKTGKLVVPATD
jgi:hypothetical protein